MWQALFGIFIALAVNEVSDLSPWLAQRMIRIAAAWRYRDSDRVEARTEEFSALIESAPGKITKVFVAGTFLSAAGATVVHRRWLALHRGITTRAKTSTGRVLHQVYLERRRRILNGLNTKDRARFLLQEWIFEKAELAAMLSEMQRLRGQLWRAAFDASEEFPSPQIAAGTVVGGIGQSWRFAPWRCRILYPVIWTLSLLLDGKRRAE